MEFTEETWLQNVDEAIKSARMHGRQDIADYILLKTSNDEIREKSVKWLIETVTEIAFAFNKHGARIKVEQNSDHRFQNKSAKLTGARLKLKQGVRCLTLEAGWTRNPGDGIMSGGALVFARFTHFGFPKATEELVLLRYEDKPQWFSVDGERNRISFEAKDLRKHFEVFFFN